MEKCKTYIAAVLFVITSLAYAHDHLNLEHGVPLEIEDAYVSPYKNREFQSYLLYDRLPDNKDKLMFVPRLEIGAFKNFQFDLATPFEFGDRGDQKQSRNIDLEGLYNFNQESLWLPAISLGGGVFVPTGEGLHGYDGIGRLNLTKTLPTSISFHRIHANIQWTQNGQPKAQERNNLMKYVFGYQLRLGTDYMFVADYFYEEQYLEKSKMQMVEVGLRYQLNPLSVIAGGVGTGLDKDSPDFRANISFQRALNLFW